MGRQRMTLGQHVVECKERYDKLVEQIAANRRTNSTRHKQNTQVLDEISNKLDGMVPKKWLWTAIVALSSTIVWLIDASWPFIARLLK